MNSTKMNNKMMVYSICVNGANPNGDPRNDNAPRTLNDGRGIISEQCIRHKIRNFWHDEGMRIFQLREDEYKEDGICLDDKFEKVANDLGIKFSKNSKDNKKNAIAVRKEMEKRFIDIRLFGNTASMTKLEDVQMINSRACVSTDCAITKEPIIIEKSGLTHCITSKKNPKKGDSDTMGSASDRVYGAVYFGCMSVNNGRAKSNCVTEDDVKSLITALKHMFDNDESVARPVGSMKVGNIVIWDYDYDKYDLPCPYDLKKMTEDCFLPDGSVDKSKLHEIAGFDPEVI